jgi:phosphatidylserine/phosphatidylglycerophosphate/cardiolipin synthase-like enzyme
VTSTRICLGSGFALLVSVLLTACGALPPRGDEPISGALPPSLDSPLARIARDSAHEPQLSGFRLMAGGYYSLDARIELVRRVRDSLDVQYYLIQNDRTGRLFMRSLRDAALRGVRVRLLVDDLNTVGGDPMFRGLAAFPTSRCGCSILFAVRARAWRVDTQRRWGISGGSTTGCTTSSSSPTG